MALRQGRSYHYVFDVMAQPLEALASEPGPFQARRSHPRIPELEAALPDLIHSVKAQGLEGLVAKRHNSRYEPGQPSGDWQKTRVNQGQEFVIAGYTPSPKNFDAIIFGYYDGPS